LTSEHGATGVSSATDRVALALGMSGALGEALLAALIAAPRYGWVHVGHRHSAGAGASKFRPWVIGSTLIVAEDAYLFLSEDAHLPSSSPVRRFAPADALRAAGIARDTGARRLALIEPAAAPISAADATAIAAFGFDTVLTIEAAGTPSVDTSRTLLSVLRIRPGPPTAMQLAVAIIAALTDAPAGRHRLGAAQLTALARHHS